MKKILSIVFILLIALALSGCTMSKSINIGGSSTATPTATAKATGGVPGNSFAGTWGTDWGNMTIAVNGNVATGTYAHDDGMINGTVSGNTMTGMWSETPTRLPPADAGALKFTMSDDGSTFTGDWWYGMDISGDPNGEWVGTRVS